ncbi:hypothetical protein GOV06_03985 [Candidatus Woesearchaeota archaeon]|nr:hypothetical protein [Candidatus Woesearchaeota archaeon]
MGRNKSSFIITLLVMFILFLSLISIVFSLGPGAFFRFELILLIILLLISINLTKGVLDGKDKWKALIKFYMVNWVNIIVLYFSTLGFKEILLPLAVTGIGFIIALIKVDTQDFRDEEPAAEEEKYVASEKGKIYHLPECNKAKRIKNQVEYDSKEEAEESGKKACDCVE